jgi:hypothetical protein
MIEQEHKDWNELGRMLDLYYENCIARIGEKWTHSALHGLACLECNGQVANVEGVWVWRWNTHNTQGAVYWSEGHADSHPAALIAMLKAHREAK